MHCGSKKLGCRLWRSVFQVRFLMWIIDSSQGSSWQYCNNAHWGLTYIGSVNTTQEGLTCQRWDSNWPHAVVNNITDDNFPDGSKIAAQNFCRNPFPQDDNKNLGGAPWCYTTDPSVAWQYCKPYQDENGSEGYTAYSACVLEKNGAHYSGYVAFTKSGFTCDLWRYHGNLTFIFPDGSAKKARNYCRNPTPTSRNGPWCYTTSNLVLWDYCDVCIPLRGSFIRREKLLSRDRVKLRSMSLVNCLHWCITHLTCVGIDFQRDGLECWYTPYKSLTINNDKRYEHYDVERMCLRMTTRSLNSDQSTVLLQKQSTFRRNRVVSKIDGIPETALEERNTKTPRSSLLAQKFMIRGADGSVHPTHDDRSEVSTNRSEVSAGCAQEDGLKFDSGTVIAESQTESTNRAEGRRGAASRSGKLLRQKRANRLEVPKESRKSVRLERALVSEEAVDEVATTISFHHEPVKHPKAKTSNLAKILSCLMILMAVVVLLSTAFVFYQIRTAKKAIEEVLQAKKNQELKTSGSKRAIPPQSEVKKSGSKPNIPPQSEEVKKSGSKPAIPPQAEEVKKSGSKPNIPPQSEEVKKSGSKPAIPPQSEEVKKSDSKPAIPPPDAPP